MPSPNPGGKPKAIREIRDTAQADAVWAYGKVKKIAGDDTHKHQLAAALAILKAAGVSLSEERALGTGQPAPPLSVPASVAELEAAATKGDC